MHFSVDNALWLAATLGEAAVIALLFIRHVWRSLPLFCCYFAWDILSNLAAFTILQRHPQIYFSTYVVTAALDSALQLSVLIELAWSVLRPLRSSLSRRSLIVVAALVFVAGAAIWPFASLPSLVHVASKEFLVYAQLQQTVSILRILFFLVLASGSQWLSIGWRDRELQVATGLGIYSLVSVIASMLQGHLTTASQLQTLNRFVVASYLCSLVYWTASFAQKETVRREFTPQMQSLLLAVAGAARTTRVSLSDLPSGKPPKQDKE